METIQLAVAVMHCKNCAANVTRHYEAVPGVSSVEVDLDGQQVSVTYDPAQATVGDLLHALDDTDFQVAVMPEDGPHPFAEALAAEAEKKAREAAKNAAAEQAEGGSADEVSAELPPAKLRIAIDGMHCANCAATIEKRNYAQDARRRQLQPSTWPTTPASWSSIRPGGLRRRHAARVRQPLVSPPRSFPTTPRMVDENRRAKEAASASPRPEGARHLGGAHRSSSSASA